eukprot:scaffold193732_cov32-Prasinocladus_malaysianus.AAC.1
MSFSSDPSSQFRNGISWILCYVRLSPYPALQWRSIVILDEAKGDRLGPRSARLGFACLWGA